MGKFINNNFQNTVGWTTTIVLIALTVMLVVPTIIAPLVKLFR
jgi:Mn2+/Fe2+ NRAMP family transporter